MTNSVDIYFLSWLIIKFVIDLIGLLFIFWRLIHYSQLSNGVGRHKGDIYFLVWLSVKFVIDFISIIYIVWRLTGRC